MTFNFPMGHCCGNCRRVLESYEKTECAREEVIALSNSPPSTRRRALTFTEVVMNSEFRYLSNGEVWALDPDAPHRLFTSAGITLAVYPGTHAGHLVEEAITDRYCYPAGDGWARAGECLDENGLERWKWRREWMPVLRSARGTRRNGNGFE